MQSYEAIEHLERKTLLDAIQHGLVLSTEWYKSYHRLTYSSTNAFIHLPMQSWTSREFSRTFLFFLHVV